MTLYNATMNLADSMGCSFDGAFLCLVLALIVFFALWGWSVGFFMDFGENLYIVIKKFFTLLRKALRKIILFLLPKLHRR